MYKLRYLSISGGVGVLVAVTYVVVMVLLIYHVDEWKLFYIWLDVIVCAVAATLVALFAMRRPHSFFEEVMEDGTRLHKRHISG